MKSHSHRIARCITLAAVAAVAGSWSTASYACSAEDYLSTICVLAAPSNDWRGYAPADGRLMSIAQNSALFALIGTTYGGDGQTTFALPDLRGRFLLGAGNSPSVGNYVPGQMSGTPTTTLLTTQMPAHIHALANVPLTLTGLAGTANLAAVTGGASTVSLTGVTYNADISALRVQASNTNGSTATPTGGYLSVPNTPAARIYTSSAPNVALGSSTIAGAITVTASGTGAVTLAGTAPVAITGGASANGATGPTGGTQPFSIMPPYVAMYYMIATSGIFPSRN
jgi:microcystin-dependent protein